MLHVTSKTETDRGFAGFELVFMRQNLIPDYISFIAFNLYSFTGGVVDADGNLFHLQAGGGEGIEHFDEAGHRGTPGSKRVPCIKDT